MFDPEPFEGALATDQRFAAFTISVAQVSHPTIVSAMDPDLEPSRAVTARRLGHDVDLGSANDDGGQTPVADTLDLTTIDDDTAAEVLDRMARGLDITIGEPTASDVVAIYQGGGRPFTITGDTDAGQACLTVAPTT